MKVGWVCKPTPHPLQTGGPLMSAPNLPPSDPQTLQVLLDKLEPDAIKDRLDAIERERDALRVLLKAACRKEGRLPKQVTG